MSDAERADLLYGVAAIAQFLGMREKQARNRVDRGEIPTFKIGGTVCARRSGLNAWIAETEAKARADAAVLRNGRAE